MNYQDELTPEEEQKHARRGCCIAMVIIPIVCFCTFCPLMSWTQGGRSLTAHMGLSLAQNGVASSPIMRGFPDVARAGCELDRTIPGPPDYQEQNDELKAEYELMVRLYNVSWRQLRDNGGNTSLYDPPSQVPGDFAAGKARYCQR